MAGTQRHVKIIIILKQHSQLHQHSQLQQQQANSRQHSQLPQHSQSPTPQSTAPPTQSTPPTQPTPLTTADSPPRQQLLPINTVNSPPPQSTHHQPVNSTTTQSTHVESTPSINTANPTTQSTPPTTQSTPPTTQSTPPSTPLTTIKTNKGEKNQCEFKLKPTESNLFQIRRVYDRVYIIIKIEHSFNGTFESILARVSRIINLLNSILQGMGLDINTHIFFDRVIRLREDNIFRIITLTCSHIDNRVQGLVLPKNFMN